MTKSPDGYGISDYDPFLDGLELNYEDIELANVAEYAKMLSRTALRDVSKPDNVIDIEGYRNERNKPAVA